MKKSFLFFLAMVITFSLFSQTNDTVKNKIVITDKGNSMEMKFGDSTVNISYDYLYSEYLQNGIIKAQKGDYRGAISDFFLALLYKTDDPQLYYNRGLAYYYLEEYENAIENYDLAVSIDSLYEEAYGQRGIAKSRNGDLQGATADFKNAIKLKPDKGLNHYNYAISLLISNDTEIACEELKLAQSPGYEDAKSILEKYCQ